MKQKYWGVVMKETNEIAYTWDIKHPEEKRKEKSVRVLAIYVKKEHAVSDVKFRGGSFVKRVEIKIV